MKVIVDENFWEIFPDAQISVLSVKGLNNQVDESKDPYFQDLLNKASKKALAFLPEEAFTQNQVIQEWREAFSRFKTKKGVRSSIEALLKPDTHTGFSAKMARDQAQTARQLANDWRVDKRT